MKTTIFYLAISTAILFSSCAGPQRWMSESVPQQLPPGTKVVSTGVLMTNFKDTLIGDASRMKDPGAHFIPASQELLAIYDKNLRAISPGKNVEVNCFDYNQPQETPVDNKGEELFGVPTMVESCRDSLQKAGYQYLVASPLMFGYKVLFQDYFAMPIMGVQLAMYDLKDGKPVLNANKQSTMWAGDRTRMNQNLGNDMMDILPIQDIGGESSVAGTKAAKANVAKDWSGIILHLGLGYSPVLGGAIYDSFEGTPKLIGMEFVGGLRYMSKSIWAVEYGLSIGNINIPADADVMVMQPEGGAAPSQDIAAFSQVNHRVIGLAFPLYNEVMRLGFGGGLNYTVRSFGTDFQDAVDPNGDMNWKSGSGVGFLLKTEFDIMYKYWMCGLSLGYDYRSAEVMGADLSSSSFLFEMHISGIRIPL